MKYRIISFCLLNTWLTACTTAPTSTIDETPVSLPTRAERMDIKNPSVSAEVDYDLLQQVLNMKVSEEELGYFEKPFNTCKVGSGFSATTDCKQMYFVLVHYRLRCRDTEGTTSEVVTEANLKDISSKPMSWTLKDKNGSSDTDNGGFGVVREIFTESPRNERLKISDGKRFLFLRANAMRTAVVPKNWCDSI